MQHFKNKLYNYETPPPPELWSHIVKQLDNEKVVKLPPGKKRSRLLFYAATAAAALVIIFVGDQLFNKTSVTEPVPGNTVLKSGSVQQQLKDSINLNHEILETIINTPQDKKLLAFNAINHKGFAKKYITIAGPEGQPVKISPKVATLILSADNENPPKPVWNKKIDKWQQIMLTSTLSPTSTNLMDILQIATNDVE